MTKTKIIELEIQGVETIVRCKQVYAEVPIEMTDDEIYHVESDIFNYVQEQTEWDVEYSEGVHADGSPEVVGTAPEGTVPDVIVTVDESGKYISEINESFE
tara:strand:+ start:433 stop:735 length:303 start_codon:yes stop_codon:yes gene_type:complete